jgi:hypothetical protein
MKKNSNHLSVISKIENVRKKNNKNWMDILRIAFRYAPNEAAEVLAEIYKEDKKLNSLAKQLTKKI